MSNPVVFLTGASSGIGAAVAVELARSHQARLALVARREEKLQEVAELVVQAGGEALCLACDVTDADGVRAAVRETEERFGPVDVAIANAGVGDPMPMKRFDAESTARTMRINFEGSTNVFAAVVPGMLERGCGRIVGVSSIAGFRGLPASGPYSASKAALTVMLESMRLELKGRGISVTAVHPGFVRTPMTDVNKFKMPFIVEVDRAARIIVRGSMRGKRQVEFPWQLVWLMRLARALPDWMYDLALGVRSNEKP